MQGSQADPGQLEIRPGLCALPGMGADTLRHSGFAPPGVRLSPQHRHTFLHRGVWWSTAAWLGDNLHAEEREVFGL